MKKSLAILLFAGLIYSNLFCSGTDEKYKNEKQAVEKSSRIVKREAGKLIVSLKNGKQKIYTNIEEDDESAVDYFFKRYYGDIGFFLIEGVSFEGKTMILLDEKNGREYMEDVYNEPVVSPDKKWILFVNSDESCYTFNGIKIYAVSSGKLDKVFEIETKSAEKSSKNDYYLEFYRWNGSDKIELNKLDIDKNKTGKQSIVLKNKRWEIE